MPVLTFEGPQLEQRQREALIKGLTDVVCEVMPEVPRQAFYVFIKDHSPEKIGVGGLVLPEYLAGLQKQ